MLIFDAVDNPDNLPFFSLTWIKLYPIYAL